MPNQYTVGEFLDTFRRIYQTIEVRAALVRAEEQLRAVYVTFRIRIADADTIAEWFNGLTARYGTVNFPGFRIIQQCFPFSHLEHFTSDFSGGRLPLQDCEIVLGEKKDISGLLGQTPWFSGSSHKPSLMSWPILQVWVPLPANNEIHGWLQNDRQTQRYAELAGYSSPYSAVRQLLEVDFESSTTPVMQIELDVPARIDSLAAKRNANGRIGLTISSIAHKALSGLRCTARQTRSGLAQQLVDQKVISLKPGPLKGHLRKWTGRINIIPTTDAYVDVEMTYEEIGRLCSRGIRPMEIMRVEERNPLFRALTYFCSGTQFKDLLEFPSAIEVPRNIAQISLKHKGRLFEISVQWLLTCLGFRAIWLHGYEKLKNGKFDYGSVDCLGYHELKNVLLLVNCTSGPPDPREMNRQIELQFRVHEQIFRHTTVRLYSVLFTASHRPTIEQQAFTDSDVRIFHQEDIPKLLALINKGQEIKFIETVISPVSRHL